MVLARHVGDFLRMHADLHNYTKQEILGQEYLYAVKRHLALLNITPDLTPPRSKRAGNWKPINKVLAMRQIPEMEVA